MHTYQGQVTLRHSKKLPSSSQEESSHHSLIMLAPSSQTCHLQNCEKRRFCSLRHPLYIFCSKSLSSLRQPLPSLRTMSQALQSPFCFSSSSNLSRPRILFQLFFISPFTGYLLSVLSPLITLSESDFPSSLHLSTQLIVFTALLLSVAICSFILFTYILTYVTHFSLSPTRTQSRTIYLLLQHAWLIPRVHKYF